MFEYIADGFLLKCLSSASALLKVDACIALISANTRFMAEWESYLLFVVLMVSGLVLLALDRNFRSSPISRAWHRSSRSTWTSQSPKHLWSFKAFIHPPPSRPMSRSISLHPSLNPYSTTTSAKANSSLWYSPRFVRIYRRPHPRQAAAELLSQILASGYVAAKQTKHCAKKLTESFPSTKIAASHFQLLHGLLSVSDECLLKFRWSTPF